MIEKEFEPAFPILDDAGSGLHLRHCGMNLRDYFAAKALHALALECSSISELALEAYRIADAMMKAREQ